MLKGDAHPQSSTKTLMCLRKTGPPTVKSVDGVEKATVRDLYRLQGLPVTHRVEISSATRV